VTVDRVGVQVGREVLAGVRPFLADERARFADAARREALYLWSGVRTDHKYHDAQITGLIARLGMILPPDLADEAAAGLVDDEFSDLAYAGTYASMVERLRFRRDMHREFSP
jgi:hypothetical protein